jgi:hypothetical protein
MAIDYKFKEFSNYISKNTDDYNFIFYDNTKKNR